MNIKTYLEQRQQEHVESLYEKNLKDFYLIVAFYVLSIPLLLAYAYARSGFGILSGLALAGIGLIAATFVEYWIHRGAFHALRARNPLRKQLAKIHGIHHGLPKLVGFTMLPLVSSLLLLTIVTTPFFLLMGMSLNPTLFFLAGLAFGYLNHEWSHHAIHYRKPLTRWGALLIELHDVHHYTNPRKNYGLMCPFWDMFYETYERKTKSVEETIHEETKTAI